MNLLLLTPAPQGSLAGNRATAERWAGLLRGAGHQVTVATSYDQRSAATADMLIALHAWRSHQAVCSWSQDFPERPVVVALTGTDLYRFQFCHPGETRDSMNRATRLIVLHRLAHKDVPEPLRHKVSVVLQSAPDPASDEVHVAGSSSEGPPSFQVCVIGHLREEKDPLRAARAARLLPASSAIRVIQAGSAGDDQWALKASREARENARYTWLGALSREATRQLMLGSGLMVISSVMEGGANVVSEACRLGLPIIASDIPGNVGLLGEDYPGLFPVGNQRALATLLERAEQDVEWLAVLKTRVGELAIDFTPERELASLENAIRQALVSPAG